MTKIQITIKRPNVQAEILTFNLISETLQGYYVKSEQDTSFWKGEWFPKESKNIRSVKV